MNRPMFSAPLGTFARASLAEQVPPPQANQVALPDDVAFWSRQLAEHALFLHLMLQDPQLKAQALALHNLWMQTMLTGGDISRPLSELLAFKRMVLARLERGEWLGWALPSFVQHILLEGDYFQRRLQGGVNAGQDFQTWLEIVKGHADIGPKLIDPKAEGFAEQAKPLSQRVAQLQSRCNVRTIEHQCLVDADQAIQQANAWVRNVPVGLNIVHPTLAAHILREHDRALLVTRTLSQSARG